jgi:hypothetical protein
MRFAVTRAIQSGTTVNVFHNSFGYNRDFEGVMNSLGYASAGARLTLRLSTSLLPISELRVGETGA